MKNVALSLLGLLGLSVCVGGYVLAQDPFGAAPPTQADTPATPFRGGDIGFPRGNENVIEGKQVVAAISESGQTIYGYSDTTGQWEKVTVEDAEGPITPIVGYNVIAFVSGTKAYAFGAESGKWAEINLKANGQPVVGINRVRIDVGSKIYLFSSGSDDWAVVDLSKD